MSLSNYNFGGKTIADLRRWFVDILRHLSHDNYSNGSWTPVITGMTGSPTVTAWYQRFGIVCSLTIAIAGTHKMTNAEITLPITPVGDGVVTMHSLTDNSVIGAGKIDSTSEKLVIKVYFVTDETVLIQGHYKVNGI